MYLKGGGKMLFKTQTVVTSAFLYKENKLSYTHVVRENEKEITTLCQ